jgi:hypothetical protein
MRFNLQNGKVSKVNLVLLYTFLLFMLFARNKNDVMRPVTTWDNIKPTS